MDNLTRWGIFWNIYVEKNFDDNTGGRFTNVEVMSRMEKEKDVLIRSKSIRDML